MKLCLALIVIMLLSCTVAFAANNPADATTCFRLCPIGLAQLSFDGGPWSSFLNKPTSNDSALSFWNWHSEGNTSELREFYYTKQVRPTVQAALVVDDWQGSKDHTYGMLDISAKSKKAAIGFLLPFDGGKITLGPRVYTGDMAFYATVAEDRKPLWGIGHYDKVANLDLAIGQGTWLFRASHTFGKYTPELRLREDHFGFALGRTF